MKLKGIILVLQFLTATVYSNHINICSDNTNFGDDPSDDDDFEDADSPSSGRGYFLGGTRYELNCCGVLDRYDVRVSGNGDLTFQLWRPSGSSFELIYQQTNTASSYQTFSLDSSVGVQDGDRWGWWTSGNNPRVRYNDETSCSGSSCSIEYKTLSALNVGDPEDWTSTSSRNDRYGIRLRVDSNTSPSFTNLGGGASVPDLASVGTSVFTVSATDSNSGDIPTLSMSMSASSYFTFNQTSAEVTVSASLSGVSSPVLLSLTVYDQCHNSGTGTLSVTITNTPPVIYLLPNSTSLSENEVAAMLLHTFSYSDPSDTVTCSVISPIGGPFSVNQSGTDVYLYSDANPGFDYGTATYYVIEIECTDGKDPTIGNFTLNITENIPPVINLLPNSTSISENEKNLTLLHEFSYSDPGDTASCSVNSPIGGPFTLTQSGNDLSLYSNANPGFDYGTTPNYTIEIACSDSKDQRLGYFTLYIIENIPPLINLLPNSTSISENEKNMILLHTFSYTDTQTNVNCSINSTIGAPFTLVQSGTDLMLYSNAFPGFDFGNIPFYILEILCADEKDQTIANFTVNIIENVPPVINLLPNSTSISENAVNTTLLHEFSYTDTQANVNCSINSPLATLFTLVQNGTGLKLYSSANPGFDYGTNTSYLVEILCEDEKDQTIGNFTVNILENIPPVILLLPNSTSVNENQVDQLLLHSFGFTDPGDAVNCYVNSSLTAPFTLLQNGTNLELYSDANPGFDYGTLKSYVLEILCADVKDFTAGYFTVNITENLPPIFNNLPSFTEISEDETTEILLFTIDVTDPEGFAVTCSLNSSASTPVNASSYFQVRQIPASTSWAIYTQASVGFQYHSIHTFYLAIECADPKDASQGTFDVYLVANRAPSITNLPTSVSLSTKAAPGSTIFTISSTDPEGDQVTYTISCDPIGCPFSSYPSGDIQLGNSISGTTITGYDVTVTASDARSTSKPRVLTVLISDINDPPRITNLGTTYSVAENTPNNQVVVTTICTDGNLDDSHAFSMTATPSSGLTYFSINSTTGEISTSSTSNFNYETLFAAGTTSFVFSVTCSDGQDSDTKSVNLEIINVNEAPYFGQTAYSISADEGVAGTVLTSAGFSVFDDDFGDSWTLSLDCGSFSQFFHMNITTGVISFSSNYDVDDITRPSSVDCVVVVTDTYELTGTASLGITINNINDNNPIFTSGSYTFFATADTPVNSILGTVITTDVDIGSYGSFIYSLNQTSQAQEYFGITADGNIYLTSSLESLGPESLATLDVVATDPGGLYAKSDVTIVVLAQSSPAEVGNSDRHLTFFDDPRNMPWFVGSCATFLVIIGMLGYVCLTKPPSMSSYSLRCCKVRREYQNPRNDNLQRNRRKHGQGDRYSFERAV